MEINIIDRPKLLTARSELLQEAERLLKKITRWNTIYGGKICIIRRKLDKLEKELGIT